MRRCPHQGVKSILVKKVNCSHEGLDVGVQPMSAPNLLANPPRMMKQVVAERDSYAQMFNKLVQFQEACCGIEAPTASWLHATYVSLTL